MATALSLQNIVLRLTRNSAVGFGFEESNRSFHSIPAGEREVILTIFGRKETGSDFWLGATTM
jgi:hypothetical protein